MKFGARIAAFARAHVGVRANDPTDVEHARYLEAVAHPADIGMHVGYYLGAHPPSTCALFASRCLLAAYDEQRAAGGPISDFMRLRTPYVIGAAIADVENVAIANHAIEWYMASSAAHHPTDPFAEGDIVVIDGPPYGVHVIVCTSDAELVAGGRWHTLSAEGGQADGGVLAFEHDWEVRADGRMYPSSASQRAVIAVVRAARFGLDTEDLPPAAADVVIGQSTQENEDTKA